MATERKQIGKVILLGARLSFASLFEPNRQKQDDGSVRETWKSNFLFPKDGLDNCFAKFNGQKMPVLKAIKLASKEAKTKAWGENEDKWPKLKPDRLCWRDGDLENWDGYADHWYLSANAPLADRPKVITNRKGADDKWMDAQPGTKGAPYSGCYVNATIEIWVQDNEHGKRVNAKLKAVQFVKDGEAFGASATDPNEDFDDDDVSSEGSFADDDEDDDDMI